MLSLLEVGMPDRRPLLQHLVAAPERHWLRRHYQTLGFARVTRVLEELVRGR